jgi:hypothetical protein
VDPSNRPLVARAALAAGYVLAAAGLAGLRPADRVETKPALPRPEDEGMSPKGRVVYFLEVTVRDLWGNLNQDRSLDLARGKPERMLEYLARTELDAPGETSEEVRRRGEAWRTTIQAGTRELAGLIEEGTDLEAAKAKWIELSDLWKERPDHLRAGSSR